MEGRRPSSGGRIRQGNCQNDRRADHRQPDRSRLAFSRTPARRRHQGAQGCDEGQEITVNIPPSFSRSPLASESRSPKASDYTFENNFMNRYLMAGILVGSLATSAVAQSPTTKVAPQKG